MGEGSPWIVPATVVDVHDGDTITCDLDLGPHGAHRHASLNLGWHIRIDERGHIILKNGVRIDGINAPELATPEGKAARNYLAAVLPAGTAVTVVSKKLLGSTEKYGRILADVSWAPNGRDTRLNVAGEMLATGHALPWDGTGARPV